jgi:hypothetical protein
MMLIIAILTLIGALRFRKRAANLGFARQSPLV